MSKQIMQEVNTQVTICLCPFVQLKLCLLLGAIDKVLQMERKRKQQRCASTSGGDLNLGPPE